MKQQIVLLTVLLLCICLMTGCQCEHDWIDATCTTPKTCSKCNETEGTAPGHVWNDANCTEAKKCSACGLTEGNALGHTPGTEQEVCDIVRCTITTEQYCTTCNACLNQNVAPIESLIQNDMFLFTPEEFMTRMEYIAKEVYPDFHYTFSEETDSITVMVYWDRAEENKALIYFFGSDTSRLNNEYIHSPCVWCVSLSIAGASGRTERFIEDDIERIFLQACDPSLNEDSYNSIHIMKFVSYLNAVEFGEPFGYHEENSILYEFIHTQNTSLGQEATIESILAYASNFLIE